MIEFEYEELLVKSDKAAADLVKETDSFAVRLKEIEVRRANYMSDRKKIQLKLVNAEITFFDKLLTKIADSFGGPDKLAELVKSKEFRDQGVSEYWKRKLARNAAADLVSTGTISKGIYEALATLPDGYADQILAEAVTTRVKTQQYISNIQDNALVALD
jgi:hypothetical protein